MSETPRDVKILHLILASMGVSSYQEHVPLQLMDFAHRYTTQVLQDALVYSDYAHSSGGQQPAGVGATSAPLTTEDIRMAVSARVNYQFKPAAPKEMLLELAQERNKRPLPAVPQGYGIRLPPEKYCLTGAERTFDEEPDVNMTGVSEQAQSVPEEQEQEQEQEPEPKEPKEPEDPEPKQEDDMEIE